MNLCVCHLHAGAMLIFLCIILILLYVLLLWAPPWCYDRFLELWNLFAQSQGLLWLAPGSQPFPCPSIRFLGKLVIPGENCYFMDLVFSSPLEGHLMSPFSFSQASYNVRNLIGIYSCSGGSACYCYNMAYKSFGCFDLRFCFLSQKEIIFCPIKFPEPLKKKMGSYTQN